MLFFLRCVVVITCRKAGPLCTDTKHEIKRNLGRILENGLKSEYKKHTNNSFASFRRTEGLRMPENEELLRLLERRL